jgi:hypothetical protein
MSPISHKTTVIGMTHKQSAIKFEGQSHANLLVLKLVFCNVYSMNKYQILGWESDFYIMTVHLTTQYFK